MTSDGCPVLFVHITELNAIKQAQQQQKPHLFIIYQSTGEP